jgi:hypothetical protein
MVGWPTAVVGRGLRTPPTRKHGATRRSHLPAGLLLIALLLLFAPACSLGAEAGAASSGPAVKAAAALEVGEMDARLAEALNAFGAGRYEECRRLAAEIVGRAGLRLRAAGAAPTSGAPGRSKLLPHRRPAGIGCPLGAPALQRPPSPTACG